MIEKGLLNRELSKELSKLGHEDKFIISDAGLAIPNSITTIDLSLAINKPSVLEVIDELLSSFSVEKIIYTEELKAKNPSRSKEIDMRFLEQEIQIVNHKEFKEKYMKDVKLVIRTGDFTSYSNVLLVSAGGNRWYEEK